MGRILLVAIAVLACSCGQAARSSTAGTGDVSLLHVSVTLPDGSHRDMEPEWYRPSTGEYDARGGLFGPGGRRVLLTREFARSGETGLMVVTGSREFVQRAGYPSPFESPGVALYRQYLEHVPQSADYRVRATRTDDRRLVLDFTTAIPTDSGTPPKRLKVRVTVDPPVSMAQARADGAFVLPGGRPDIRVRESPPGSPSHIGLHPWWLGAAWEADTARTVIEESSTLPPAPETGDADIPPGGRYQVAYRLRSTPADAGLEPDGVPSVPGVGNIPKGEVYVTSFRRDAKPPLSEGGSATPITVDGTPATFILPGPDVTTGLFWVRTRDALVEVRLWYQMDATPDGMRAVAAQLRPVP